jgi:hypothetical protein
MRAAAEEISGYSIYEVDGRFRAGPGKFVDERVLVIRIIYYHDDRRVHTLSELERPDIRWIIDNLISFRLAEELSTEDEVWSTETHSLLSIRRKRSNTTPSANPTS